MKLSARERELLERLREGPALAGHWDFSGSRVPDQLRSKGLIERCDHPDTIDRRSGRPAGAYTLTDAGRAALKERKP